MFNKCYTASIVILLFIFFIIAAPAVAREEPKRFDHSVDYRVGGLIDIYREFGQLCITGAVRKQSIRGYGELTKVEDVKIAPHIMSMYDKTDWTVAADAIRGLSVTTTIELCARPMSAAAHNYALSPTAMVYSGDIVPTYASWVIDGSLAVRALTSQIWVTDIFTNPGHSGSYQADFIAAYGPGPYEADGVTIVDEFGFVTQTYYDEEYRWWFDFDKKGYIDRGDYYVGNYFNISQHAYTSEGELRRFFSMSSPFSNSYIVEDLHVIGMAEIKESFTLHNLKGGPKAIRLTWWEFLF